MKEGLKDLLDRIGLLEMRLEGTRATVEKHGLILDNTVEPGPPSHIVGLVSCAGCGSTPPFPPTILVFGGKENRVKKYFCGLGCVAYYISEQCWGVSRRKGKGDKGQNLSGQMWKGI
jgi:hypothetical protein